MIFLSLGAGVQSSVMLMRAISGDIERPDHVIFADTGFEPQAVYRHVAWCAKQCAKAGIPFHQVQAKMNIREEFEAFEAGQKTYWNTRPPFYVAQAKGDASHSSLIRQCTRDAKIKPVEKKQRELLGYGRKKIPNGSATVLIGISTDEARRAVPSRESWYDREYPLIDPLKMSRLDCQHWWEMNFPHVVLPSSSCVICPYKTDRMWRQMQEAQPEDFALALEYDERIRLAYEKKTGQRLYVHRDFVPLADADLNQKQGGLDLEDKVYCAGGCGL